MDQNLIHFSIYISYDIWLYFSEIHITERYKTTTSTFSITFLPFSLHFLPLVAVKILILQVYIYTFNKIILYAVDILCLTNASTVLPEVIKVLSICWKISDYIINWSKLNVLPLSEEGWNAASQNLTIIITIGTIKYLQITVSAKMSDLCSVSYLQLLQSTEEDPNCRKNLPTSFIGRTATVTMNVLPKINYLSSITPILPTSHWFNLDSAVAKFYWKHNKPRIKLTTIQKPRDCGGLAAPNFKVHYLTYYWLCGCQSNSCKENNSLERQKI